MYATFLIDPDYADFLPNVQNKNYQYFYDLAESEEIDPEFRELMQIIKKVSYDVNDELKADVFGYMENITILANIYAGKKLGANKNN